MPVPCVSSSKADNSAFHGLHRRRGSYSVFQGSGRKDVVCISVFFAEQTLHFSGLALLCAILEQMS